MCLCSLLQTGTSRRRWCGLQPSMKQLGRESAPLCPKQWFTNGKWWIVISGSEQVFAPKLRMNHGSSIGAHWRALFSNHANGISLCSHLFEMNQKYHYSRISLLACHHNVFQLWLIRGIWSGLCIDITEVLIKNNCALPVFPLQQELRTNWEKSCPTCKVQKKEVGLFLAVTMDIT